MEFPQKLVELSMMITEFNKAAKEHQNTRNISGLEPCLIEFNDVVITYHKPLPDLELLDKDIDILKSDIWYLFSAFIGLAESMKSNLTRTRQVTKLAEFAYKASYADIQVIDDEKLGRGLELQLYSEPKSEKPMGTAVIFENSHEFHDYLSRSIESAVNLGDLDAIRKSASKLYETKPRVNISQPNIVNPFPSKFLELQTED